MTQTEFRTALLNPAHPVPAGMTDGAGRPAGRRFDLYRNNVAVSLTESLEQGFPVLRRLLGDDYFAALAGVFLRRFPPSSGLMMLYGAEMPDFLKGFSPVAHLPYLPDIARLEQALRAASHAADAPALPPNRLAGVPPDRFLRARLCFAPAMRLIRSDWPVYSIWLANMRAKAPAPAWHPEDVLILRPEFDANLHLLGFGAAEFIAALMAGATVGDAVAAAGKDHDLTQTLALLLSGGALIDLNEETP
ncbi:MAG: DNA-binding domain-containing protein [Paracoccaceae bacterium]|nr:DNA-binding domain-containing protein [Paracoccaceae bacterium]